MYADDAILHAADKQQEIVESKLQIGTDDFKNWCLSNNIFIHIGKTSVMTVGSRQNVTNLDVMEICIDNEIIKEVETKNFLALL